MTSDLIVEPIEGDFDVAAVEAHLLTMPLVVPDPKEAHHFFSHYTRSLLNEAVEAWMDEGRLARTVVMIIVDARQIAVVAQTSHPEVARHFVAWLRRNYKVRFLDNDYGGEVRDVDDNLEKLFGSLQQPAIAINEDTGWEVMNDPVGVVQALISALMSKQGNEWARQLVKHTTDELRFSPALHATWAGDAWCVVRDDIGEEMRLAPAQIDELLTTAWRYRHDFLMQRFPIGATLDDGRFELVEDLHGEPDRGLYRGTDRQRDVAVLITLGSPQRDPLDAVRQRFGYEVPGIATLRHIGPLATGGEARYDGLVEDEPAGTRSSNEAAMDASRAARLGVGAADIVAAAHARGITLVGIRPELVYVDGDRVTGIAPRCEPFHMTMKRPDYGVAPAFSHLYLAPEVLARPDDPPTPAADVFSLAATIAYWHTGAHPFTGEYATNLFAITAGQRTKWTGDPKLGAILDRALAPLPQRIRLDQLISMLRGT